MSQPGGALPSPHLPCSIPGPLTAPAVSPVPPLCGGVSPLQGWGCWQESWGKAEVGMPVRSPREALSLQLRCPLSLCHRL